LLLAVHAVGAALSHLILHLFLSRIRLPPGSTLFPYTTLFRSAEENQPDVIFGDAFGNEEAVRRVARDYPDIAFVFGSGLGPVERSEEHTSELQSRENLVCRLLLEKKNATHDVLDAGQELPLRP